VLSKRGCSPQPLHPNPQSLDPQALSPRPPRPFTDKDRADLQFLYDEWAHPFFISKEQFVRHMDGTGALSASACEDWKVQTLPSWRQSIWVGVVNPWPVIAKLNPKIWWTVVREIVCLERMHQAFSSGLMEYGAPLWVTHVQFLPRRSEVRLHTPPL